MWTVKVNIRNENKMINRNVIYWVKLSVINEPSSGLNVKDCVTEIMEYFHAKLKMLIEGQIL